MAERIPSISLMPRKRSAGDGALYFDKGKKLWRAVVDVGFWPDGRRRQKAVSSKSQAIAREKLRAVQKEIAEHGAPIDRKTTVAVWSQHWLDTVCAPHLKPNTLASHRSSVNKWILPHLGKKSVAALKPSDIRIVHKAIRDAGRSTATLRRTHVVLSSMLEAARLDGIATRNVAEDVVTPDIVTVERGALSTAQALAVLEKAASHEDGTRWWTALLSGLRQGERLGARLDSLDLAQCVLHVEWSLDEISSTHGCGEKIGGVWPCGLTRGGSCPKRKLRIPDDFDHIPLHGRLALIRPKSGKPRTVPLIPALAEALRRYLVATAERPNPYGLIWRKPDGDPWLPGEDQQAWRDLLHEAGIIDDEQTKNPKDRKAGTADVPTTHWARHTTATVLMELGVDAKIIGEIVGHVDEKTTRGYQHVSSAAATEAMSKLGQHFSKALER